ncbi:MAG: 4Fe-4S dicluster domain-containing protein [Deltaproteobacteria bacterium]|nr:4Fe-4S dicluster domain-containing protein [Deltaproteobacteria bacterium]
MKQLIYLKNVVTLTLDNEKCNGCRICETVCPHGVLQRSGKKAQIHNRDACMECGACAANCQAEAISVQSGVGCANAIINGFFRKDGEVCCGPSDSGETKVGGCCC